MKRNWMVFVEIFLLLSFSTSARAELPSLRSGDLIFHTSLSSQSKVIQRATGSELSHVGIVEVEESGRAFVVEAISQVSRTDLRKWIARGSKGKFAVFRIVDLPSAKAREFLSAAKKYLGRSYDIYFTGANEEIYCSELVDFAARDSGMQIGRYQRFGSLDVDNDEVRSLAKARWRGHPLCEHLRSFKECWSRILEDQMITPLSLTEDARVKKVYSNY